MPKAEHDDDEPNDASQGPAHGLGRVLFEMTPDEFDRRVRLARERGEQADLFEFERGGDR